MTTNAIFSPSGLLIASSSFDKTVKIWKKDGELYKTLEGHTDIVTDISFAPIEKYIVSSSYDMNLIIWNTETGI